MKNNDEMTKQLIEALRPSIEKMVEEILAERARKDPRFLESIRTGPIGDRVPFTNRSIQK